MSIIKKLIKKFLRLYYKRQFKYLGKDPKINPTSYIRHKKQISAGDSFFVGKSCHISIVPPATLTIGNYVGISPYARILGGDRDITVIGKPIQITDPGPNLPMVFENDVYIGLGAIILKGVNIGEGSIVGAGAVLSKDVPPYTIYGGNPAKKIRNRFTREQLIKHLELVGSKYKIDDLPHYAE